MSGRSLAHLSQQDALRILAASQRPVTLQIKGQRGRGSDGDRGSWEPLPLNLQHLNLPLPMMGAGLNASSPSYQDRYTQRHDVLMTSKKLDLDTQMSCRQLRSVNPETSILNLFESSSDEVITTKSSNVITARFSFGEFQASFTRKLTPHICFLYLYLLHLMIPFPML